MTSFGGTRKPERNDWLARAAPPGKHREVDAYSPRPASVDSSDTGSDIQGGPGLRRDDGLLEPTGTTSNPDIDGAAVNAGPDIGDADLDSDSDRNGIGERAAAGRDSTLAVDVVLRDEDGRVVDGEMIGDDAGSGGHSCG